LSVSVTIALVLVLVVVNESFHFVSRCFRKYCINC